MDLSISTGVPTHWQQFSRVKGKEKAFGNANAYVSQQQQTDEGTQALSKYSGLHPGCYVSLNQGHRWVSRLVSKVAYRKAARLSGKPAIMCDHCNSLAFI